MKKGYFLNCVKIKKIIATLLSLILMLEGFGCYGFDYVIAKENEQIDLSEMDTCESAINESGVCESGICESGVCESEEPSSDDENDFVMNETEVEELITFECTSEDSQCELLTDAEEIEECEECNTYLEQDIDDVCNDEYIECSDELKSGFSNSLIDLIKDHSAEEYEIILEQDEIINEEITIPQNISLNLNGFSLHVINNFNAEGLVDIAGGYLEIDGDYNHVKGTLTFNGGKVTAKNYKLETYLGKATAADIDMSNSSDSLSVSGDIIINVTDKAKLCLTDGYINIGGNLVYQGPASALASTGENIIVPTGNCTHSINMGRAGAMLNRVMIPCSKTNRVLFVTPECYKGLLVKHDLIADYSYNEDSNIISAKIGCVNCGLLEETPEVLFDLNGVNHSVNLNELNLIGSKTDDLGNVVIGNISNFNAMNFVGWYDVAGSTGGNNIKAVPFLKNETIKLYARWAGLYFEESSVELEEDSHHMLSMVNTAASDIVVFSEDETVCTISDSGLITGIAPGTTKVHAYAKCYGIELDAVCDVVVKSKAVYQITYFLNGGVNNSANILSYDEYTSDCFLVLEEPKRDGYIFEGWYDESNTRVFRINKNEKRNIKLTAKWKPVNVGLWIDEIEDSVYDGKAKKPVVRVFYGQTELVPGVDYSVHYSNNVKVGQNTAKVNVKGKGNYSGTVQRTFSILPVLIDGIDIGECYATYIPGKTFSAKPDVYYNGKKLRKDIEYTLDVTDVFVKPGRFKCTVKGKGNYSGTAYYYFTVANPLNKSNLAKASAKLLREVKVGDSITSDMIEVKCGGKKLIYGKDFVIADNFFESMGTYKVKIYAPYFSNDYYGARNINVRVAGSNIAQANVEFEDCAYTGDLIIPKYTIKDGDVTLVEGRDYRINAIDNNINPGRGRIVIEGRGRYRGTKQFYFVINKVASDNIFVEYSEDLTAVKYTKKKTTPSAILWCGENRFPDDKVKIKYFNNKELGTGTMVISSPYMNGTITTDFNIVASNINSLEFAYCPDIYDKKNAKPVIYDFNGLPLKAGVDFTYDVDTMTAYGINNYVGSRKLKFNIGEKVKNLDFAKVKPRSDRKIYYTGRKITADDIKYKIVVTLNGNELIYGDDYEIIVVPGNPLKGSIKIYVKGKGTYAGMREAAVKVISRSIN